MPLAALGHARDTTDGYELLAGMHAVLLVASSVQEQPGCARSPGCLGFVAPGRLGIVGNWILCLVGMADPEIKTVLRCTWCRLPLKRRLRVPLKALVAIALGGETARDAQMAWTGGCH